MLRLESRQNLKMKALILLVLYLLNRAVKHILSTTVWTESETFTHLFISHQLGAELLIWQEGEKKASRSQSSVRKGSSLGPQPHHPLPAPSFKRCFFPPPFYPPVSPAAPRPPSWHERRQLQSARAARLCLSIQPLLLCRCLPGTLQTLIT